MKEKTKEFLKKNLIGFILGVVSAGTIIVYAETYFLSNDVTYDNSSSGLSSTNVQGAIDELYGVCFPKTIGDTILDNTDIVTSGDGLYKDEYESCRYLYKGTDPNNYITFNESDDGKAGWRIISVECDGTIKIMKYESETTIYWDNGSTDWSIANINSYLNNSYYNVLSSNVQNQIVTATYNIGTVTYENSDMKSQINDEKGKTWNGKVALVTLSEYIRASSNQTCNTFSYYSKNDYKCSGSNWMYPYETYYNGSWWTLSQCYDQDRNSFFVGTVDKKSGEPDYANPWGATFDVRPVVTLSSDVKIIGGDGSQNNPYTLE